MKKLNKVLFGFGSITAIVAPVAAVVACGDKEEILLVAKGTKITTEAQVKDILAKAKYNLSAADATNLFNAIKDKTVVATHTGKLGDASHGANDFVILLKGTENTATTKTTTMRAFNEGAISTATHTHPVVAGGIASTFATRWGITETEYNGSTMMVYIQSEPNATFVSYANLVKVAADNNLYHDESTSKELRATLVA